MPSSQDILADIDLLYRNTFTVAQKLVWFNEEQRELFDILEIDSPPYAFRTVQGERFYPFPDEFDVTKIKVVTFQVNDSATTDYVEVPFKRNDDNQSAGGAWYSIVNDAMYLHIPGTMPDSRNVYIYVDSEPADVSSDNLTSPPDLPTKFQEILKLGVLKRIAGARKDVVMYSNYDAEHEQKIADVLWQRKLSEPNFVTVTDTMPRAGNARWRF